MRKPYYFAVLACVLCSAGCATGNREAEVHHSAPVAQRNPSADVWVVSATYGSGTKYADVTERVDELLHEPNVEFFARPEWLHADPSPGWNKALVIVYEVKGRRHIFTAGEGDRVAADLLIRQTDK